MDNKLIAIIAILTLTAGSIGAVTYAFFSDTETSYDNEIASGKLELTLGTNGPYQFSIADLKPSYDKKSSPLTLSFVNNAGKLYKKITNVRCDGFSAPTKAELKRQCEIWCSAHEGASCMADCLAEMNANNSAAEISNMDAVTEFDLHIARNCADGESAEADGYCWYTALPYTDGWTIDKIKDKWIFLGQHGTMGVGGEVTIKQSFHMVNSSGNEYQEDRCRFDELFLLDQDNAPMQSGCNDNSLPGTVCGQQCTPAAEVCDGSDNDCDSIIDEGLGGEECDGADTDSCAEGTVSCVSGQLLCSDDTESDVETCNGLDDDCNGQTDEGSLCPAGQSCNAGVCQTTCTDADADGYFAQMGCGTNPDCDDTNSNINPGKAEMCDGKDNNCDGVVDNGASSSCSAYINGAASCSAGACMLGSCNTGFGNCDGMSANGCEIDLKTTTNHCGVCGMTCPSVTNGVPSCAAGVCSSTCNAGYTKCTGQCVNTLTSASNCGACGTTCPARANAIPTCSASVCGFTCNAGYSNCDGVVANGCEVVQGTPCGVGICAGGTVIAGCNGVQPACSTDVLKVVEVACNGLDDDCDGTTDERLCPAGQGCSGGVCAVICNAGWANCDGDPTNGCEADLANTANCGTCGNTCIMQICFNGACIG